MANLENFPVYEEGAVLNSPRSRKACAIEGIDPLDLEYKPIEAFADPGLSPRLVKLRYDFFEAKRQDLLVAARRRRKRLIASGEHELSLAKQDLAKCGTVQLEQAKLDVCRGMEHKWLNVVLGNELRNVEELTKEALTAAKDDADNKRKDREMAMRRKELNDQRRAEEAERARRATMQEKYEKQMMKREFEQKQKQMQKEMERKMQEKREAHERAQREAEAKLERERQRAEEKEREYQRLQQQANEQAQKDMERTMAIARQREKEGLQKAAQRANKDERLSRNMSNLEMVQYQKREKLNLRMGEHAQKEARLRREEQERMERGAQKSFQLMIKRQNIKEDAERKMQERRDAITQHREDMEMRLAMHEDKKQRYLEFKRELDGLKEKNRKLNVDRQHRRLDNARDELSTKIEEKDQKANLVLQRRQQMWDARKQTGSNAQKARDMVKQKIMEMRIKSNYDPTVVQNMISSILGSESLSPARAKSMPSLHKTQAPQAMEA